MQRLGLDLWFGTCLFWEDYVPKEVGASDFSGSEIASTIMFAISLILSPFLAYPQIL
jgi:hypothetical protein